MFVLWGPGTFPLTKEGCVCIRPHEGSSGQSRGRRPRDCPELPEGGILQTCPTLVRGNVILSHLSVCGPIRAVQSTRIDQSEPCGLFDPRQVTYSGRSYIGPFHPLCQWSLIGQLELRWRQISGKNIYRSVLQIPKVVHSRGGMTLYVRE